MNIFYQTTVEFLKFLPILLLAIIISQLAAHFIPIKKLTKKLKPTEKNIIKAGLVGISTPGPLLAFLPMIRSFKQKGVPSSILAAFITGQTLIGPGRLVIEIKYLGTLFFICRAVLAVFIATAVGICFKLVERKIQF